jgi:type I restriction enzyme, S subunit
MVCLGDAVTFRGGGTPRKDVAEYWSDEIPWATVKDFKSLALSQTQDSISKKGLASSASNLIPAGHVIIPTRMALGKAAINTIDVAINQDLRALVPKQPIDTAYLLHSMLGLADIIERNGSGATVKGITQQRLAGLQIPLPPLSEQKRIAGILDAADALRAKRREALAQLDTLLQSTFLDMFGDPVTNPMGWGVVKFRNLGASRLGKMLDKAKQEGNCQFPYLANFNVQWAGFKLENLRKMDFDADDRVEFELRDGDLLICEGGEVGRTAIWRSQRKNVYFQKALHRVRLDPTKALPEFGQYFMWFMAKNGGFRDFTNSATISHLTGAKLKTLPVPLPPLALQHRFAAIVESVEGQKARMRAHLAELDALFASLQSRAFKGAL